MRKNLIPIIAKEFGLQIGEEFRLQDRQGVFQFTKDTLLWKPDDCEDTSEHFTSYEFVLGLLVCGQEAIIRPPFEPKTGEEYWTFDYDWDTTTYYWHHEFMDYLRKANNCVFRTQTEAEQARPQIFKDTTGREWEDEEDYD